MLYSDGRKASSYDMGVRMNRLVNRLSESLAEAEKVRCGVALLYSDASNAFSDARDNRGALDTAQCAEQSILALRRCYTLLNQQGLTVDFLAAPGAGRESPGHPSADSPLPPGTARGGTGAD